MGTLTNTVYCPRLRRPHLADDQHVGPPEIDLSREIVDFMTGAQRIHDYDVEWQIMGEPFRSAPGKLREAVVSAVEDLLGVYPDLNTGGGTSDGRYIAPLGTEVLELGLLNTSIHQIDERTPIHDLDRLQKTYLDVLNRLYL